MRTRRGAAVLLASYALVGCGGSESIDFADLPARIQDVDCVVDVRCGIYPDDATCRAAIQVTPGQLQADVASGKVRYDGAAAASCLDAAEAAVGSCRLSQQPRGRGPTACDRTFVGTLAAGAACSSNDQCSSAECDRSTCGDSCCLGTCQAPVAAGPRPAGAACELSSDCVSGTFCSFGQDSSVCTPLVALGQSCEFSSECQQGTGCIVTPQSNGAHVCAVPPGEGEPCFDGCDRPGDYCDLVTFTCQALHAVGASCSQRSDNCVFWAYCAAGGTCVARGGIGAACDVTAANTCLSGLTCDGGTCAVPPQSPVCPQP